MRCSLPLAGRDDPAISMAIPFNMRAVARSRIPCSSDLGFAMNWKTLASEINAARSLTGTPARVEGQLPARNRREFGRQIANSGMPEHQRRPLTDGEIDHNRLGKTRRQ